MSREGEYNLSKTDNGNETIDFLGQYDSSDELASRSLWANHAIDGGVRLGRTKITQRNIVFED